MLKFLSRFLIVPLFLLALVGFTFLYSKFYVDFRQEQLVETAREKLTELGFHNVTISAIEGMDVHLSGWVSGFSQRNEAREVVDNIFGLRALEERNQIRVPGELKTDYNRERNEFSLVGGISGDSLGGNFKDRLETALSPKNITIDYRLENGDHFQNPTYFSHPDFKELIIDLAQTMPRPASISAFEEQIELRGEVTGEYSARTRATIDKIGRESGVSIETKDRLVKFPSIYHIPGYYRQSSSGLTEDRYRDLQSRLLKHQVFFDIDESAIDEFDIEMYSQVKGLSNLIKGEPNTLRYILGGHADASGNFEQNQQLSEKRARAVMNWLIRDGIDPRQLRVESFGSIESKGDQDNAENRRLSRRVEAVLE